MNVSLTPELEAFVYDKVTTGFYSTASEVIREALRLLVERDRNQQDRLEALRKEIAIGIKQADQGRTAPLEAGETLKKLRKKKK